VIVRYVDIGGAVDHHCLNYALMFIQILIIYSTQYTLYFIHLNLFPRFPMLYFYLSELCTVALLWKSVVFFLIICKNGIAV
jgi:hypothetical protein